MLGEHTDYNEGRSLGIATRERTVVVADAGPAGVVEVTSTACGLATCSLAAPVGPPFVLLAASLARTAGVDGVRLRVDGDLPVGAGLSSSASYAVAVALALGIELDAIELARCCQAAERVAGTDVGLLDQLVILEAREGTVVALDFTGPGVSTLALHPSIGLTVVDSGERRELASTAYGERRAECAAAAAVIGPLGHAGLGDLGRIDDALLRRRARHVVTECRRVDEARTLLRDGDLVRLGQLLDEGHASLRDDFEVSTPSLEALRAELAEQRGCVGVRLTGAGFGGCLLVAHDPAIDLATGGRWSTRLEGAGGAAVSSTR